MYIHVIHERHVCTNTCLFCCRWLILSEETCNVSMYCSGAIRNIQGKNHRHTSRYTSGFDYDQYYCYVFLHHVNGFKCCLSKYLYYMEAWGTTREGATRTVMQSPSVSLDALCASGCLRKKMLSVTMIDNRSAQRTMPAPCTVCSRLECD